MDDTSALQDRPAAMRSSDKQGLLESSISVHKLRLLVVIASYGERNIERLRRVIATYQGMCFDVDIVVVSEAPKDLGPRVNVVVGLPSRNPWSLPFGHKRIFAENVERYDLFAYSEDDMEVTEENIKAFVQVTPVLERDEIAGFLRYESDPSGNRSVPEAHGSSHWKPETVRQRGEFTVAEFSNEHAAFYLLTQTQLKRAIASGGFIREPYEGRYDMLCTAATDPYTCCGFRKVICISDLNRFLIRHLSNQYVGKLGPGLALFNEQVQTLVKIGQGLHPVSRLCSVQSNMRGGKWSKCYDESSDNVLEMIPAGIETLLSIGCGSGKAESELIRRGVQVTALPLDSVIGSVAERRGIKVVYGSLQECLGYLEGRTFQCILLTNLLHLRKDPESLIIACARLLEKGGVFVVEEPNFERLPVLAKRVFGLGDCGKLQDFELSGINAFTASRLTRWMRRAGFQLEKLIWSNASDDGNTSGALGSWQKFRNGFRRRIVQNARGRFTSDSWIVCGRK